MIKRNLRAKVLRTRGGHALPMVLSRIEDMTEEEARQWLVLLENLESEAETTGRQRGARQPWRR